MTSEKYQPPGRDRFRAFELIQTRWHDNDVYQHVNNVIYYSYFDTAVNKVLVDRGVLNIANSSVVGLVIETQCKYFAPIAFPDLITVGICTTHIGNSSVRYEIGIFRNEEQRASAVGHFVHVYVDRTTNRPVPIPDGVRGVLNDLKVSASS
ncbi:MAG: acyl-CoA thioesterase [Burkholderiaceae bacterium]|nr:acyl-CoA thioesterase [Burkholderiaceae bacterium]